MKHKLFLLIWLAMLSFLFMVAGVLALLDYSNVEIIFWTSSTVESKAGKIVWITISGMCLIIFSALAIFNYKKINDRSST